MTTGWPRRDRKGVEDRKCSDIGFSNHLCAGVARMSQEDLRFGVVGLGLRSGLAKHAHLPGEGSRIVAVCDPVEAQRQAALAEYPEADAYADHTELLDLKLDGVFLTTPDDLHEDPAIDFLRPGVAGVVETP